MKHRQKSTKTTNTVRRTQSIIYSIALDSLQQQDSVHAFFDNREKHIFKFVTKQHKCKLKI